jgi:hypothetical protein
MMNFDGFYGSPASLSLTAVQLELNIRAALEQPLPSLLLTRSRPVSENRRHRHS